MSRRRKKKQTWSIETKLTMHTDIVSVLFGHDVRGGQLAGTLQLEGKVELRANTDMLSRYFVSLVAGQNVQSTD